MAGRPLQGYRHSGPICFYSAEVVDPLNKLHSLTCRAMEYYKSQLIGLLLFRAPMAWPSPYFRVCHYVPTPQCGHRTGCFVAFSENDQNHEGKALGVESHPEIPIGVQESRV